MTKRIIPQTEAERSRKLNEHLQGLKNLYKDDVKKVVYLCYELGATTEQVGNALGVSPEAITRQYPKRKGNHHGRTK